MGDTRRILGMTVGVFTGVVLAIIAIVVLSVGTLDFGWFLTNQNLTHQIQYEKRQKDLIKVQNQNVQNQSNVQEGYITAIEQDETAITDNVVLLGSSPPNGPDLVAQNIHSGQDACHYGSLLTGTVPEATDMQTWLKVNCADGTLTIKSNIWHGGNGV